MAINYIKILQYSTQWLSDDDVPVAVLLARTRRQQQRRGYIGLLQRERLQLERGIYSQSTKTIPERDREEKAEAQLKRSDETLGNTRQK